MKKSLRDKLRQIAFDSMISRLQDNELKIVEGEELRNYFGRCASWKAGHRLVLMRRGEYVAKAWVSVRCDLEFIMTRIKTQLQTALDRGETKKES